MLRFFFTIVVLLFAAFFAWPQRVPLGREMPPLQKEKTDEIALLRGEIAELRNRVFTAEERLGALEHPAIENVPTRREQVLRVRCRAPITPRWRGVSGRGGPRPAAASRRFAGWRGGR